MDPWASWSLLKNRPTLDVERDQDFTKYEIETEGLVPNPYDTVYNIESSGLQHLPSEDYRYTGPRPLPIPLSERNPQTDFFHGVPLYERTEKERLAEAVAMNLPVSAVNKFSEFPPVKAQDWSTNYVRDGNTAPRNHYYDGTLLRKPRDPTDDEKNFSTASSVDIVNLRQMYKKQGEQRGIFEQREKVMKELLNVSKIKFQIRDREQYEDLGSAMMSEVETAYDMLPEWEKKAHDKYYKDLKSAFKTVIKTRSQSSYNKVVQLLDNYDRYREDEKMIEELDSANNAVLSFIKSKLDRLEFRIESKPTKMKGVKYLEDKEYSPSAQKAADAADMDVDTSGYAPNDTVHPCASSDPGSANDVKGAEDLPPAEADANSEQKAKTSNAVALGANPHLGRVYQVMEAFSQADGAIRSPAELFKLYPDVTMADLQQLTVIMKTMNGMTEHQEKVVKGYMNLMTTSITSTIKEVFTSMQAQSVTNHVALVDELSDQLITKFGATPAMLEESMNLLVKEGILPSSAQMNTLTAEITSLSEHIDKSNVLLNLSQEQTGLLIASVKSLDTSTSRNNAALASLTDKYLELSGSSTSMEHLIASVQRSVTQMLTSSEKSTQLLLEDRERGRQLLIEDRERNQQFLLQSAEQIDAMRQQAMSFMGASFEQAQSFAEQRAIEYRQFAGTIFERSIEYLTNTAAQLQITDSATLTAQLTHEVLEAYMKHSVLAIDNGPANVDEGVATEPLHVQHKIAFENAYSNDQILIPTISPELNSTSYGNAVVATLVPDVRPALQKLWNMTVPLTTTITDKVIDLVANQYIAGVQAYRGSFGNSDLEKGYANCHKRAFNTSDVRRVYTQYLQRPENESTQSIYQLLQVQRKAFVEANGYFRDPEDLDPEFFRASRVVSTEMTTMLTSMSPPSDPNLDPGDRSQRRIMAGPTHMHPEQVSFVTPDQSSVVSGYERSVARPIPNSDITDYNDGYYLGPRPGEASQLPYVQDPQNEESLALRVRAADGRLVDNRRTQEESEAARTRNRDIVEEMRAITRKRRRTD